MNCKKPRFVVKKNLQKSKSTRVFFSDAITVDVLRDVCYKITGRTNFEYEYVDNEYSDDVLSSTYNKGRLAILYVGNEVNYITFSEQTVSGRNSSVQSVPTAFNIYFSSKIKEKNLYYYFIDGGGNIETDYQIMMYRLMKTIGFKFLNEEFIHQSIVPFSSSDDLMLSRKFTTEKNKGNISTYITKSSESKIDIYGKTYGASKYETSMICYALSTIAEKEQKITLYEMLEQNLKELPKSSLEVLKKMGNIEVIRTDSTLERESFEKNNSLRSPRYIYNLLRHLGPKKCALCNCEIPELVQGAHIWPVAQIKKQGNLSYEDKLKHATNGNNGIWLCANHHKLFDENIIIINPKLEIEYGNFSTKYARYLDDITKIKRLQGNLANEEFLSYVVERNKVV